MPPARLLALRAKAAGDEPACLESRLCFSQCFLEYLPPKVIGSSSLNHNGQAAPALLLSPRARRGAMGWHNPGKGLPSSP